MIDRDDFTNPSAMSLDKLRAYLSDARERLLDTTTRNRLIHVNRKGRLNALSIINERTESIYRILGEHGKKMSFAAQGKDKPKAGESPEDLFETIEDDTSFDEARFEDLYLETPLGPDAQHKRLLKLYAEAKSADEDMGFNILYLAMGFLQWRELKGVSGNFTAREAPLILLPVSLIRNPKTSTFDIIGRDEDLATNLSLQARLKTDFGINLPEIEIGEEGFNPLAYFEEVRESIDAKKDWDIDVDGMLLCGFRFAKLAMLRDLDPDNWPNNGLLGNPLVRNALGGSFDHTDPILGNDERIDDRFGPADLLHVLDADASQTVVIEEVRAGRNLVVQGPPGTGKSQTIANMIAALAHDGKRVLFLAEKMAALSVVKDRLDKVGLENLGLEIYSNKANKRQIIDSLGRTILAGRSVPNIPVAPDDLKNKRDTLNDLTRVLHQSKNAGSPSPYQVVSRLISYAGRSVPAPLREEPDFVTLTDQDELEFRAALVDIEQATKSGRGLQDHPNLGFGALDLQPTDLDRLARDAQSLADGMAKLKKDAQAVTLFIGGESAHFTVGMVDETVTILNALGAAPLPDQKGRAVLRARLAKAFNLTALIGFVETARAWALAQASLSKRVNSVGMMTDWAHLRSPIAQGSGSFFKRLGGSYRGAMAEVRSFLPTPTKLKAPDALSLIDEMIALANGRHQIDAALPQYSHLLGDEWREQDTNFDLLLEELEFLNSLPKGGFDRSFSFFDQHAPNALIKLAQKLATQNAAVRTHLGAVLAKAKLDAIERFGTEAEEQTLNNLQSSLLSFANIDSEYDGWVRFARARRYLIEKGAARFVNSVKDGLQSAEQAADEIGYARAEAQWKAATDFEPQLANIRHMDRTALAAEFRELEGRRRDDVKAIIRGAHLASLPSGQHGGMGTIRSEIGKKRRHLPIRKLITQAGDAIQRLKPVMLMSPLSVAQYLPPEKIFFDVLIIDEASQVRPEDALGAIARSKQIVVVGDRKQLPPTSFFSRSDNSDDSPEDDDDDDLDGARATELESILTLCEARGMRAETLEWHYRSRDPSLIRVSNSEFYGGRLVLPPSPLEHDDSAGLGLRRVQGVYHPSGAKTGRPATNPIEAEAIVEELRRHARDKPDISAGIVTFSVSQRNMVQERLELARRQDDVLDGFLREGGVEDVFVKNIENVQGDERDIIYISVGYGPHEPGKKLHSMSFGPVNSEGGERRLNVLFSRARIKCLVFCSFDPADIDLSRTTKRGPKVLKTFLQFADTGQLNEDTEVHGGFDSPFEEDVATIIEDLGYQVDAQIGTAGFRIDLGVRHPNNNSQYMLAVECDGATYHSALWARERDRLRQDVLEYLGWRFHRIWSTDWFYRRASEIERLRDALEDAAKEQAGRKIKGSRELPPLESEQDVAKEAAPDTDDQLKSQMALLATAAPAITAPVYVVPQYHVPIGSDLLETSPIGLRPLLTEIVKAEGPIHRDEIANRVAQIYGRSHAGSKIKAHLFRAIKSLMSMGAEDIIAEGDYLLTQEQFHSTPVRSRANLTGALTKVEFISPLEIRAAADVMIAENGELDQDALTKAISEYLGFKRLGPALKLGINEVLDQTKFSKPASF